ncbi:AcrB/AcrD/AcrF family protein [Labilibaculum sp. A4]|uniref:efflux RND transporter permease subunit n=1 Tax=Labilibaculum euxinus TaxID=2686357 RepID=UPI000F6270EC|nr:efflux RND transporter permease subunit [Labilibaculum euxinus]MDQ1769324.1 efflux RND transporter permease subunit [Labilibaculum euxinus]MWN74849.1 AcrB/AcrD/AcrF family protein [Labilibaculum euxinus]
MEKIFVRFKSPIAVILLLILIGGGFSYQSMKTSLFPNVTFPKIKIIVDNGEQPVDKMMVAITRPIENAIKKVENLNLIRSITSMGSCEISAFMNWDSDIDLDKQQVESQIAQIKNSLPSAAQITIEKMNPSILPVIGYSIQSDQKSQVELKRIAEYIVKPYLSRIKGVAAVDVIGGKVKEYRIVLDEQKLNLLRISLQQISSALQQTNFIESNGYTVDYKRLYLTVTDASIKNKEQLENLVLFNDAVRSIKVSDVANVEIAERNEYVKIKANGKDVPLIAVLKQPNSNLMDVSDQVAEKVSELAKILPDDVILTSYYNQGDFVNRSIHSIIDVLWIGLLLSIVVVIVFLRSVKSSTVILITIPLTLTLTFIILSAIGFDFNIMTIGAIAASIGLIIDDAIIVVEQIHRTHEEFPDRKPNELVGKAIRFLFPSMVSSSLSTIVILIPFELMTGVAGAYFKILTETMMITLLCSFVITWLGLPVIYLLLSKNKGLGKHYESKHSTHQWIRFFLTKPYISILFSLLLILSIVWIMPKLSTGFLPEMDEGSIVLDYNSPAGTSLEETDRMLSEVDKIIESIPDVKTYSRRTGTQMGFFITESNRGDYLIELKSNRKKTTEEVTDDIRSVVEQKVPALNVDFGQVISDMLGDLMSSVQPIEIKIFGDDHDKLKLLSKQIADSLETVKGTADVFDGIVVAGPILRIFPKEGKLKQFGLSASDLQAQLETHLTGTVIGTIQEEEQLTDIRMIFPMNNKTAIEKIKDFTICIPSGTYLPVKTFADFDIQSGVSEIERENLQTMGVVTARLNNRDLGSTMKDIKIKLAEINLPPSYQITYGGAYAEQQKSFSELLKILIAGGLMVFTVVLFMFKKLAISLVVLFISVLGISGSLIALYFTGTPLNVGSYTGLIMIIGIIGENSIFTIQQFYSELKNTSVSEALSYAISTRLRPKLMTASAAVVALSPLALGIGTGAQMHQPLAIAVIGGLIIALPLLLIVLPGLLNLILKKQVS